MLSQTKQILIALNKQKNPKNIAGMARFGITGKNVLGISMPVLRQMAKKIKKQGSDIHEIAEELWESGIHEAKILASIIDDPKKVSADQMDRWIKDFDSWDVCDQTCLNLFDKTDFAFDKCIEWSQRKAEFEKRAGFALMAAFSWHRRDITDEKITEFFPSIIKESTDERNFVRKAVNWALRQIGKRSEYLEKEAVKACHEILKLNNKTANWVAGDALREFEKRKGLRS